MEILGVGGAELVAILIIMLVIAGPKRMLQWAYIMGKYAAKARAMWAETMTMVQKEIDAAGMDIQVPKDIPTRQSLNRHITQAAKNLTKPIQTTVDEVGREVKQVETEMDMGTWSEPQKPVNEKG